MAGAGYFGYQWYIGYLDRHVSLEGFGSGGDAGQIEQQDYVQPPLEGTEALDDRHVRWCLKQAIVVATLEDLVSTNLEIGRLNSLKNDRTVRCDLESVDGETLAAANEFVAARRDEIVSEAIDAQLLLLGESVQSGWTSSEQVADIQRLLDTLGYDVGSVDGLKGRRTETAIKAFERDQGLELTGEASKELLAALRREVGKSS